FPAPVRSPSRTTGRPVPAHRYGAFRARPSGCPAWRSPESFPRGLLNATDFPKWCKKKDPELTLCRQLRRSSAPVAKSDSAFAPYGLDPLWTCVVVEAAPRAAAIAVHPLQREWQRRPSQASVNSTTLLYGLLPKTLTANIEAWYLCPDVSPRTVKLVPVKPVCHTT